MKKLSLVLIFVVAASVASYAQQQSVSTSSTSPISTFVDKKNEIGIFGQAAFGYTNNEGQVINGIQYKHWIKPNVGIRILGGFSPYYSSRRPIVLERIGYDTVRVRNYYHEANTVFVGLGIEAQRHFYKRVFLYAAVDIIGGYGTGQAQTNTSLNSIYNSSQIFISNNLPDYVYGKYSRTYVKLLPNIGSKIVFKRFDFGLDMSAIDINWTSENSELIPTPPYSRLDITVLNYTSFRLSFNYRF